MTAKRLYGIGFAVLSVVLAGTLWCTPYLPTNDGPQWVFASHMESHYGDPAAMYSDVFVPALQFACRGFTIILTPLEDLLGWQNGLRLALTISVLLAAWGLAALVYAVDPRRAALAFVAFPLALTWHVYMGFFAFGVGSALGLFILALAVRWTTPTLGQRAILSGLLFAEGVAHIFSAVLTGIVILVLLVARASRGRRLAECFKVAAMGLPALCILLACAVLRRGVAKMAFAEDLVFAPASLVVATLPRILAPGPPWRAIPVTFVAIAALVLAAFRVSRLETSVRDRILGCVAIGFVLLAVFAPLHVPGWQFFSPRFVPLGVALLLVTVPLERIADEAWSLRVRSGLFVVSAAWLGLSYPFHQRLFASCKEALAGLESPVRRHRDWLPVTLAPEGKLPRDPAAREVPYLAPLRHVEALYATVEGGLTPYYFADSAAVYPFTLRRDGPKPPPVPDTLKFFGAIDSDDFVTERAYREGTEGQLATFGMFYEGVLVTGATPEDLELWHARGYEAEWQEGGTMIGHFVPCRIEVVLPVWGVEPPPKLDVGVGEDTVFRDLVSGVVGGEGKPRLVVEHGPCGEIWVRPKWDVPRRCGNARKAGQIVGGVGRSSGRVVCEE